MDLQREVCVLCEKSASSQKLFGSLAVLSEKVIEIPQGTPLLSPAGCTPFWRTRALFRLADWITPSVPMDLFPGQASSCGSWPGFSLFHLGFFFDPKRYWGSDRRYLEGRGMQHFLVVQDVLFLGLAPTFVLQAWKELSTLDTEWVFSWGFFLFPCLISFPFLSTILKNGMDGGEKHFHVEMWATCSVRESRGSLILTG